jgi:poly-gamma-glutamate synthesis protein (capsule biosynthesis protein)
VTTLCFAGDVMTGRGIDRILPHPGDPRLLEPSIRHADGYVRLAEAVSGPIPRPVPFAWPWGDALDLLERRSPDLLMINVETAITRSDRFAERKTVCYRMNPANLPVLLAAEPDVCVLANNHVLDFGSEGLLDTIDALAEAGQTTIGAGADAERARRAALVGLPAGGRVVCQGCASPTAGVPPGWATTAERPGVNLVIESDIDAADALAAHAQALRRPGDLTVVAMHWGSNWGYQVPDEQIRFAHRLVDRGIDIVYGHSSHHPRPVEVYRDHLILYGCGDLINDYEGIIDEYSEHYRGDLRLLYSADVDSATGRLLDLRMDVVRSRRLRLEHASRQDAAWLGERLTAAGHRFGTAAVMDTDGTLRLESR